MHPAGQFFQVLSGQTDGEHRGEGNAYAGDEESQGGVPGIPSGILPHERRKYQVSCTKKEGKQHEPYSDKFIR